MYNHEAGILHASTSLQTLRDLILDLGGEIYESCRVTRITNDSQLHPIRLHLSLGQEIVADRVVLATGSWIHRLLSDLHLPVRMTRQYLLYFSGLPISDYGTGAFPSFIAGDIYGFPIHQGCNGWVKATSHAFGAPTDPDNVTPQDDQVITTISKQIRELLPALNDAQIARVDSCMYDVSPDEDFILDRLPSDPRVIFATGLSGHGFKFGLLLGDILSSLVSNYRTACSVRSFPSLTFRPLAGTPNEFRCMIERCGHVSTSQSCNKPEEKPRPPSTVSGDRTWKTSTWGDGRVAVPLWSPEEWGWAVVSSPIHIPRQPTAGNHKGPLPVYPTAFASTEFSILALVDAWWLVMRNHRQFTCFLPCV